MSTLRLREVRELPRVIDKWQNEHPRAGQPGSRGRKHKGPSELLVFSRGPHGRAVTHLRATRGAGHSPLYFWHTLLNE